MGFDWVSLEAVQIAGALVVLVCFLLAQAERINPMGYRYLVANFLGSTAMTATAIIGHEWGFVFLEGAWALVSAWGLAGRFRGRDPGLSH